MHILHERLDKVSRAKRVRTLKMFRVVKYLKHNFLWLQYPNKSNALNFFTLFAQGNNKNQVKFIFTLNMGTSLTDPPTKQNTSCSLVSCYLRTFYNWRPLPTQTTAARVQRSESRLKLGHTSSGGILLAKAPFIPSAVSCLFGSPKEFDLLCPGRKLCKRYSEASL